MNIFSKLTGIAASTDDHPDDWTEERPRLHKTQGPQSYRFISAGQQRRAAARAEATRHRKTNRAYRRSWMTNNQALANLRGQVEVMENTVPFDSTTRALRRNAYEALAGKFPDATDPIAAAREHLNAVEESKAKVRR